VLAACPPDDPAGVPPVPEPPLPATACPPVPALAGVDDLQPTVSAKVQASTKAGACPCQLMLGHFSRSR
jgi:hypothetical protein